MGSGEPFPFPRGYARDMGSCAPSCPLRGGHRGASFRHRVRLEGGSSNPMIKLARVPGNEGLLWSWSRISAATMWLDI